jgi:hypothetical protein
VRNVGNLALSRTSCFMVLTLGRLFQTLIASSRTDRFASRLHSVQEMYSKAAELHFSVMTFIKSRYLYQQRTAGPHNFKHDSFTGLKGSHHVLVNTQLRLVLRL